jgi:GNAT superfamily N-acetyltransferase
MRGLCGLAAILGRMTTDVQAIELASLAGVPPVAQASLDGWLLNFDPGPVGRAASAVPLSHAEPPEGMADRVQARYAARSLPAMFRLPRIPAFQAMTQRLAQAGLAADSPSLMQVGTVDTLCGFGTSGAVMLASQADAAWGQAYLAFYSDPAAARGRLAVIERSRASLFALVLVDGEPGAVGVGSFHGDWMCINAMNTRPAHRGRGLASRILGALGREARARGVRRTVLQVEEGNTGAQSLYAKAGFRTAWAYDYWQR